MQRLHNRKSKKITDSLTQGQSARRYCCIEPDSQWEVQMVGCTCECCCINTVTDSQWKVQIVYNEKYKWLRCCWMETDSQWEVQMVGCTCGCREPPEGCTQPCSHNSAATARISCLKNNSLFTDQDTKHKMSTIYPQNITLDSYLPKEKKYPQHICKRFCQFPLALLINFPFKFATTVNAQFIVIFENCSYHMDPVWMQPV